MSVVAATREDERGTRELGGWGGAPRVPDAPYAVLHLVAQEVGKDLIGPQVIDHMAAQIGDRSPGRPASVTVGFLEPARAAVRPAVRTRVAQLRRRAPGVRMVLLPYVGRLGVRRGARLLASYVRRLAGGLPLVMHCRGESAAEWAIPLRERVAESGVVVDLRGAWPDELLLSRGYDSPEDADAATLRDYHANEARIRALLGSADATLAVSAPLATWAAERGADPARTGVVPCCVAAPTRDPGAREAVRASLGLRDALVIAYLGGVAPYQHLGDGLLPFVREAVSADSRVHLLALTDAPARLRELMVLAGLPPRNVTVLSVPQDAVPRYLAAADCGVLLRAPSRVNRVSMPVKLGEYLAAGLPLIVSAFAPWVRGVLEDGGAALVVDVIGADADRRRAEARRVCAALRERSAALHRGALAVCERHFVWSRHLSTVRSAYACALVAARTGDARARPERRRGADAS